MAQPRENNATVNVLVYENKRVVQTNRIVRAAAARYMGTLSNNNKGTFHLSLTAGSVASWDDAVVVALVEYRPDVNKSAFDMMQAAIAVEGMPPTATPTPTPWPTPTPGGDPILPAYMPFNWR